MNYFKYLLLIALIIFATLSAIGQENQQPNGKMAIKEVPIEAFHKIEIDHGNQIHIFCGKMPRVKISGSENVLGNIELRVIDKTLSIKATKWIREDNSIIKIYVPFITNLVVNSSSKIIIKDLETEYFKLTANTGNLTVSGKVNLFDLNCNGGENLDCKDLLVSVAKIKKSNASNVHLNVLDSIYVNELAGSLTYENKPVIISAKGVDREYIMTSEKRNESNKELKYVKLTLKNNSNQKRDFYIKGPTGHPFSYGFPMRAGTTRAEDIPVGTRIWLVNKLGVRTELVLKVSPSNEGKTIALFDNK